MKPTIILTAPDLAIAAVLILVDGAISIIWRLGLHRQLAIAAVRMVLQLLLIGVILTRVFAAAFPPLTLLLILVMVASIYLLRRADTLRDARDVKHEHAIRQ